MNGLDAWVNPCFWDGAVLLTSLQVFEGDDSPPVTPPSKSPSPSPLGVHPTPVDDVVLVTQPVEDAIEEKEGANDDAEEDVGEDKGKSGDGAKDGEP